jgi:hypothetical protein
LGVKLPQHEAHHSPPSSVEVKECMELYLYSPNTLSWHGAQLKGAQGQLYLYLYITSRNYWCNIVTVKVHAPNNDKNYDSKDSFYETLECVFHQFSTYHIKIS